MRGLTPSEYAVLRLGVAPSKHGIEATDDERGLAFELAQQGRLSIVFDKDCFRARLTPEGKEAMRIFEAIARLP
jgi:hypothetical protein